MQASPPPARTPTRRRRRFGARSSRASSPMRERIPWALRAPVRRARNALTLRRALARQRTRWEEIAAASPRKDGVAVSYGYERMPADDDVVYGGHVKFAL